MDIWGWIWLGIIIVLSVAEAVSFQMIAIWFVAGSVCALVGNLLGAPVGVQIVLCVGISLITLVLTRPLVSRYLSVAHTDTNAERYLGKRAEVLRTINNIEGTGQVKVLGSVWSARSADGSVIETNTPVEVQSIDGVKLIVKQIEF